MLLKPTKSSHPDKTVLSVALAILRYIKKNRIDKFDNLRGYVKRTIDGGDFLFMPALSFLFLLGTVEYHMKNDSIEYVAKNENF